jgi:arginase family enzyme
MDVVEVSPTYDVGEITSLAAATMVLNMLGIWAAEKEHG